MGGALFVPYEDVPYVRFQKFIIDRNDDQYTMSVFNSERGRYLKNVFLCDAELMEMKTNKAAKQLVKVITSSGLQPLASIVSIVKATAMILESYKAVGEDADYLEMVLKSTIGPARQEVRETLLPGLGKDGTGN